MSFAKSLIKRIYWGKKRINTSRRIAIGFMLLILAGALLLMLPISCRDGKTPDFLSALYVSTSAVCITGLTVIDPGSELTLFGQAVLLALIQIGGLGFMTMITIVFLASKRNIDLRNRMILAQSLGLDTIEGVVKITKHVLVITAAAEGVGAAVLSLRFVPKFGPKGIWYGVFHSVSAYCNAGFDILGNNSSMLPYAKDPVVLITLAALLIIGGIGFIVWEEIGRAKSFKRLDLYAKIVLVSTALLLVGGTALFFLFEYSNPKTIGGFGTGEKLLAAFFQSATTRTAGFDAIGQAGLTEQSKILTVILMMIGGASGSTAGGVKVGTFAVAALSCAGFLRRRNGLVICKRCIKKENTAFAYTLIMIWLFLITLSSTVVSMAEDAPLLDCVFEMASAYDTVGLTSGITAGAGALTKWISIFLMYFGRVGITTISISVMSSANGKDSLSYPEGHMLIG
ncbi:MAG: potassium transporter TrkG [Clostridiales bacterium]|nr:potassium transporter TrkG [Clostridiales bacterium]